MVAENLKKLPRFRTKIGGRADRSAFPGSAWKRVKLPGFRTKMEAEPTDRRFQALPGNEWKEIISLKQRMQLAKISHLLKACSKLLH